MSRKEKIHHFIYKTTDTRNGNYYVGMHSTDNLNDGYIGSGTRLRKIIYKHGKEIFNFEILEHLTDRASLKIREKEIINSVFLNDVKCLNLKEGGTGGFCNETHRHNFLSSGGRAVRLMFCKLHHDKMETDPEYRENVINKLKELKTFLGKHHSIESKLKIGKSNSIKQLGEKNSQFGTCWITNEINNKKIKKTEIIPEGWSLGRTRKINCEERVGSLSGS